MSTPEVSNVFLRELEHGKPPSHVRIGRPARCRVLTALLPPRPVVSSKVIPLSKIFDRCAVVDTVRQISEQAGRSKKGAVVRLNV